MYRRSIHVGEPLTVDIHADEHITPDGRVRRILLLEDRSDYRQVLQDHLAYSGYKVTPVHSGIEGLREIMAGPFDVIICDMLMPRMTEGIEGGFPTPPQETTFSVHNQQTA